MSADFDFPKYKWVNTYAQAPPDTNLDFVTPMIHAMEAFFANPININEFLVNFSALIPKQMTTSEYYHCFMGKCPFEAPENFSAHIDADFAAFSETFMKEITDASKDANIFNSLGSRCTVLIAMIGLFCVANLVLLILSNCRALPEETAKPGFVKIVFFYLGSIFVLSIAFFSILSIIPLCSIRKSIVGLKKMIPETAKATISQMDLVVNTSTPYFNPIADGLRIMVDGLVEINSSLTNLFDDVFSKDMDEIFNSPNSFFNQIQSNNEIQELIKEINSNIDENKHKLSLENDMEICKKTNIDQWNEVRKTLDNRFFTLWFTTDMYKNISMIGNWNTTANFSDFLQNSYNFCNSFLTEESLKTDYPTIYEYIYHTANTINIVCITAIIFLIIFGIVHIVLTVIYVISFHNCWKYSGFVSKYVCIQPCCCLVPFSTIGILSGITAASLMLFATMIIHVPDAAMNAFLDRFENRSITIPKFEMEYVGPTGTYPISTEKITFEFPENITLVNDFLNSYPDMTLADFLNFREFFQIDNIHDIILKTGGEMTDAMLALTPQFFSILFEFQTEFLTNVTDYRDIQSFPDYQSQITNVQNILFTMKEQNQITEDEYNQLIIKLQKLKEDIETLLDQSFNTTIQTAKNAINIPNQPDFLQTYFNDYISITMDQIFTIMASFLQLFNAILDMIQVGVINGPCAYISNIFLYDLTNIMVLFVLSTLCGFVGFFLILLMLRVLRSGMPVPLAMVVPLNDLDMYEPAELNDQKTDEYENYHEKYYRD